MAHPAHPVGDGQIPLLPLIPTVDVDPAIGEEHDVAAIHEPTRAGPTDGSIEQASIPKAPTVGLSGGGTEEPHEPIEVRVGLIEVRVDPEIRSRHPVVSHVAALRFAR